MDEKINVTTEQKEFNEKLAHKFTDEILTQVSQFRDQNDVVKTIKDLIINSRDNIIKENKEDINKYNNHIDELKSAIDELTGI